MFGFRRVDDHDRLAGDERIGELLEDVSGEGSPDFWLRHLQDGLLLFVAGTLLAASYLALTPDRDNRALLWGLVGVSVLTTVGVVALPRRAIVRSPHRMRFFVGWSTFTAIFVSVVVGVDDGLRSPLALLLFAPITYASLAYPARAVVGIGAVAAASAIGAALVNGDTLARTEMFVGTIAMVTLLCASVTRSRRAEQMARKELTERLVDLATRDGLTGCFNHRTFYEAVAKELARSARHDHDVSLLVVDVDNFKSINDTLGHLAGDDVLRSIGKVLTTAGRASDVVGRIGGDEFAVLLPETDRSQAEAAADRLRQAVVELAGPRPVAVTVGVAHLGRGEKGTMHDLVARADGELYARKMRS